MKVGDRVKVAKISDYAKNWYKKFPQGCPLGKIGIVTKKDYNPNMAVYGRGNQVYVRFDGEDYNTICIEEELEVIS